MARIQGRVLVWDSTKSFGFAEQAGGADVFIHRTELRGGVRDLNPGDTIEYEVSADPKNPNRQRGIKVDRVKATRQLASPISTGRVGGQFDIAAAFRGAKELLEMAKDLGVKLVPCQMTMDLMGLAREDLIDGIEEPAGAATALAAAEGATTLFI